MASPSQRAMTDTDDADLTETVRELFDLPFHRDHGIEVESATRDHARLRWPFEESLLGNPEVRALHGGVISALADSTGAAPFVADLEAYTPTIDLRMDYLSHAGEADLVAEATVSRRGSSVGVADVTVYSGDERVAVGRGVYKLSP